MTAYTWTILLLTEENFKNKTKTHEVKDNDKL